MHLTSGQASIGKNRRQIIVDFLISTIDQIPQEDGQIKVSIVNGEVKAIMRSNTAEILNDEIEEGDYNPYIEIALPDLTKRLYQAVSDIGLYGTLFIIFEGGVVKSILRKVDISLLNMYNEFVESKRRKK